MQLFLITKSYRILLTGCVFFSFLSSGAYAQTTPWGDDGEIESAEVLIEKDRKIELPPANRNFEKVPPPPLQNQKTEQKYQFKNFNYQVKDLDPRIRVLTIKEDPLGKLYPNFVKGGLGNYFTTYAEGFFNNTRSKNYSYGAHVKHHAAQRGPVDDQNSGSSQNTVALNGKYLTPNLTFAGDLRYNRDKYYFYGYNPILEIDRSDIRQVFNKFNANASIENINPKSIHYKLNASFTTLSDLYDASETQGGFNLESDFKVGEMLGFGIKSDLYLTNRKDELGTLNRNLFRLRPHFLYDTDLVKVRGGFNFVLDNDTISTNDQVHFYPFVNVEYSLSENFAVYGGIDGDINRNTLTGFVSENPFLAPNVPILNTNKTFEFYGGIKGKLIENLGFNAGLSSASYDNMYFFINSVADSSKFDIVYDTKNSGLFNFFAEINYNKAENFRASVRGDFYDYTNNVIEEPWHKPVYRLSFLGTYNIFNKILLNTDLNLLGGIKAKNFQSNEVHKLKDIVDLSVKADYLFSEKFSIFLSFNNILSKNYERYLYYPSRGLVVMAGVTYSF